MTLRSHPPDPAAAWVHPPPWTAAELAVLGCDAATAQARIEAVAARPPARPDARLCLGPAGVRVAWATVGR